MKLPLLDLSLVSAARYLSEAILMVRGLVLAWILGPAGFGVWTSMRLVLMFSRYAHMGARSGMVQRSAFEDGREAHAAAMRYRRTGAGVEMLGAALMSGILVAAVVLADAAHPGWWIEVAALVLISRVYGYYMTFLASQRLFGTYAAAMVALTTLGTAAGLWAAYEHGLGGFITALAAAHLAVLLGCVVFGPAYPLPRLDPAAARELIVTGFPIMGAGASHVLLWNADKLLIWVARGSESLGVYSVQAVFTTGILLLPTAVQHVILPHLRQQLGRTGSDAAARHALRRGTLLLVTISCPIIGVVALILHAPIRWLLPEYMAAIEPGELLVIMSFFALAASVPSIVLVSLDGAWTVIATRLAGFATAAGAIAAVLVGGYGFLAVAVGLSCGLVLYGVLTFRAAFRRTRLPARDAWRTVLWLGLSFCLLLALVETLTRVIPDAPARWTSDLVRTAARCGILLAVLIPWSMVLIRRLDLLRLGVVDDELRELDLAEEIAD